MIALVPLILVFTAFFISFHGRKVRGFLVFKLSSVSQSIIRRILKPNFAYIPRLKVRDFGEAVTSKKRVFKDPFFRFIIIVFCGMVVEFFSWLNNFKQQTINPPLFHPLLVPDLLLGFGFYFGLALAWFILCKKYAYSLKEVIGLTSVYAICIEQKGAIFFSFNPILWIFVSLVYISMILPAFILVPNAKKLDKSRWKKYLLTLAFSFILSSLGVILFSLIFKSFLPPQPKTAGF